MEGLTDIFSSILEESGLTDIFGSLGDLGSIAEDPSIQSIIAVFTSLFATLRDLIGNISLG